MDLFVFYLSDIQLVADMEKLYTFTLLLVLVTRKLNNDNLCQTLYYPVTFTHACTDGLDTLELRLQYKLHVSGILLQQYITMVM